MKRYNIFDETYVNPETAPIVPEARSKANSVTLASGRASSGKYACQQN
jgi:hypothetical protein